MTQSQLIKRIEKLERGLKSVQEDMAKNGSPESVKTAEDFFGMFQNDPDFKEAMKIGAAYRKSLRPRVCQGRAKKK